MRTYMDKKDSLDILKDEAAQYIEVCGRPDNVFEIRPDEAALIPIDMQRFVCAPSDGRTLKGLTSVIENINLLADACRMKGVPVIWLRQNFSRNNCSDNVGLYRAFHKNPLSSGMFNEGEDTHIYEGMHFCADMDHVVLKNRYSAFALGSSTLEEVLKKLNISQLWICGVATNVCVESTARDAIQRDIETIMISDACASSFELIHEAVLLNFRLFYGDVRKTREIVQLLDAPD